MYVSVWYYYCFVAEEREIVVLRERVGVVWERKSKSKEKRSCLCLILGKKTQRGRGHGPYQSPE